MIEQFTTDEKIKELETELKWRHRVYTNSVKAGRMSQKMATRKIKILNAIIDDYKRGDDLFSPIKR